MAQALHESILAVLICACSEQATLRIANCQSYHATAKPETEVKTEGEQASGTGDGMDLFVMELE